MERTERRRRGRGGGGHGMGAMEEVVRQCILR